MIHSRKDYQQRFGIDPALEDSSLLSQGSTPIAESEPVMLFRAQDMLFVGLLRHYLYLLRINSANPAIIKMVEEHIDLSAKWQQKNGAKVPDIPPEAR